MTKIMLLIWPLIPILWACEKSPENLKFELTKDSLCDGVAKVDQELFENSESSTLFIDEIQITENCLWVRYSASGCNGESWELELIGSEAVQYSLPPQRNIRFILKNNELCEAHITKEKTFDISALRSEGEAMLLNVINSEHQLMYHQ
ncbi:MAG TPA: hypothetical protein VKZ56_07550 [Membranihabitans sp.]|nr:hypothetical protein [Membranihabitans sp.]